MVSFLHSSLGATTVMVRLKGGALEDDETVGQVGWRGVGKRSLQGVPSSVILSLAGEFIDFNWLTSYFIFD